MAEKFDSSLGKKPADMLHWKPKQRTEHNVWQLKGLQQRYHKVRPRLRPKEIIDMSNFSEGDHIIVTGGEYYVN